ncbi:zinc-ribbon domain-containing protein [Hymenobacter setariae]|uniref:Zinc-ribbon domain-containing protein n=1 Tax=Hymenobacter setariae TaxID=2594794 RepID=A0A558BYG3_9BACT|nr:zinc-ribbon domain-containing protein [Hymenobacter setariae]TVT41560.1 zinc-ribbon domain-containing protein [Hymenobacter setariae]
MIFFFGTGTSIISNFELVGVSCVNCGTRNSVFVTVYSRYLHLFWIPVLPMGKSSVSKCGHCQQVFEAKQMPPAYREPALEAQQQARIPVTNYLALAVVGVLFVGLMIVGALGGQKHPTAKQLTNVVGTAPTASAMEEALVAADPAANEPLLEAPKVADIYAMRNPDKHYSLMRVARIAPDTVYLQTSTYRPTSLEAVSAHPDSIMSQLNNFLIPMPRANVAAMNKTKLLTVVRK